MVGIVSASVANLSQGVAKVNDMTSTTGTPCGPIPDKVGTITSVMSFVEGADLTRF